MPFLQSIPIANRRKIYFHLTQPDGDPHHSQTFSGAEIQISKAGGALANAANSGSVVEIETDTANYVLELSTGEIDTPGPILIRVVKSGALVLEMVEEVLPAIFGSVVTGTLTATSFTTNLTDADNVHNDALIRFLTGNLAKQVKKVGDFANTGGLVTLAGSLTFTGAPANGDVFEIVNG